MPETSGKMELAVQEKANVVDLREQRRHAARDGDGAGKALYSVTNVDFILPTLGRHLGA